MKIGELGEFALIRRIRQKLLGTAAHSQPMPTVGDDCSIKPLPDGKVALATTDMLIEGRHFVLGRITPRQLGFRAMMLNLSDIAAMGGEPKYALVSLGLSKDTQLSFVEGLYDGFLEVTSMYGVDIDGGNITSSEPGMLIISIAVYGIAHKDKVLMRSSAQPGDVIFVTGSLGHCAAIELTRQSTEITGTDRQIINEFYAHTPRIKEGLCIAASCSRSACIDISDGLLSDLRHIIEESKAGAVIKIEKLPIWEHCNKIAQVLGEDPLKYVLSSGDEYELLFTVPPDELAEFMSNYESCSNTRITPIGEITPQGEGLRLLEEGKPAELPSSLGYDHLL